MYNSGDAAEQIVRMSLEGAEVALKITGSAAKNIAAALYTVLKDQKKTKGKARIETMLRQQRPMTIYTVKKEDCPEFARQAKSYGILYAPIPIKKGDDTIDILVFEDDAGRANRIVEKFKLVAENTASIKSEIEKSRESRGSEQAPPSSLPRKRARKISWWTKCWKNPRKKKRASRKIRRRRKRILFPKRRKNPLRPRLPPRTAAGTQRVLLTRRKNPSGRNCGRFRRRGSRKRSCPMKKKPPRQKRPRRKPPPINSRPKSGNPNRRRGNTR